MDIEKKLMDLVKCVEIQGGRNTEDRKDDNKIIREGDENRCSRLLYVMMKVFLQRT